MTRKAAVVFFLLAMEERPLTLVPRMEMETHFGVHLMLSTLESGLTAVRIELKVCQDQTAETYRKFSAVVAEG